MSTTPFAAATHVEQAMRVSRWEAERLIGRYRMGIFAFMVAADLVMMAAGQLDVSPIVPGFHAVMFVAAAGILLVCRKVGAPLWLSLFSLTLDLAGPTWFFNLGADPAPAPEGPQWVARWFIYIPPAMFGFFLLVNSLRNSRLTAVYGALLAATLFMWEARKQDGVHPAQYVACVFLSLNGVVGYAAARRARHNLELFARMQLLGQYLPGAAVEKVLHEGLDKVLEVGGQQVEVTVLSSDLRGFTAMSERLTPAQVVEQLNELHGAMLAQVQAHGGSLDKFIGDGMLVVFGITSRTQAALPDSGASAAVACARAMLETLDGLNQRRAQRGLPPMAIGVGVHTGHVIAGNIGAPGHRVEFTVIGDAVNTAARLEGLTKQLGVPVVISEETTRRLGQSVQLHALPPTPIRGKQEPVALFALSPPAATPLVGTG